jgi:hypothetical protein
VDDDGFLGDRQRVDQAAATYGYWEEGISSAQMVRSVPERQHLKVRWCGEQNL